MRKDLIAWQFAHYAGAHTERRNLALHLVSAPLFVLGALATLLAPFVSTWLLLGALGMVGALAVQGFGHRRERVSPEGFLGAVDFVSRFAVEQLVTFPRYVLSGGFVRAWRAAGQAK